MRKILRKQIIHSFIILIMVLAVAQSQHLTGEEQKIARLGNFSLRRAAAPEHVVTGVILPELKEARLTDLKNVDKGVIGKWGCYLTLFDQAGKRQVRIAAAVYESVKEAEDMALQLLNDTSVSLTPGSKSAGVIGTHSWYLISPPNVGTIIFIYNNSLFQVSSSDYEFAENSAKSIVEDLSRGVNGIRLGKKVALPEITGIEMQGKLKKGETIALNLAGRDPANLKLSFTASAASGQVLPGASAVEKKFIIRESGTDRLEIYAVNEMCVVSKVLLKNIKIE